MEKLIGLIKKLFGSSNQTIIQSGNGSIAIQGSQNVVINGSSYSPEVISVINNEVFIDGFHQGTADPIDLKDFGLIKGTFR